MKFEESKGSKTKTKIKNTSEFFVLVGNRSSCCSKGNAGGKSNHVQNRNMFLGEAIIAVQLVDIWPLKPVGEEGHKIRKEIHILKC